MCNTQCLNREHCKALSDFSLRKSLVWFNTFPNGQFCMLFCLLIFFQNTFFEKFFQEYHQIVKQFRYMCLAQGHKAVMPVRLEPAAPRSQVKHSTTEPLRSLNYNTEELLKCNCLCDN